MWLNKAPKHIYQKDVCLTEVGEHAQNMIAILHSIINMIDPEARRLYDRLMSTRIVTLVMTFIRTP